MKAIAVTVGIGVLLFGTSLFTRDRPDTRWRNGGLSPMSQEAQPPAPSRASTIPTPALPDPPVTGSLSIAPPVRADVLPPSRHKLNGSSRIGKPPDLPSDASAICSPTVLKGEGVALLEIGVGMHPA